MARPEIPKGRQWPAENKLFTYEEPVTIDKEKSGRIDSSVTTHPAFAQIGAFRITGTSHLYGSDFVHNGAIRIKISASELHRDLSKDWHFARGGYLEVELSEAQWATFVSSLNMGEGIPCTLIGRRDGDKWEYTPWLPAPESRVFQAEEEMSDAGRRALEQLDALIAEINGLKVSEKQKAALRDRASSARSSITSTMPFILHQFTKAAERTVERAKVEVNAYATRALTRLGLGALLGSDHPIVLGLHRHRDDEEAAQ